MDPYDASLKNDSAADVHKIEGDIERNTSGKSVNNEDVIPEFSVRSVRNNEREVGAEDIIPEFYEDMYKSQDKLSFGVNLAAAEQDPESLAGNKLLARYTN